MYRRYRDIIYLDNGTTNRDLVGETFEYPTPDGDYCVQGSDEKDTEKFWFDKVEGVDKSTYLATISSGLSCLFGQAHAPAAGNKGPANWYMALAYRLAESRFPVASFTLPFEYMSSYAYLKAFVDLVDQTGQYDLFDNENIKLAVTAAWESYGRAYHIGLCLVYMLYLALLSYSNFAYQTGVDWVAVSVIVLALNSLFSFVEVYQAYMFGLRKYLLDYQNVLEVSACALVFAGTIARLSAGDDTTSTEELMAVASVLVWFNALNLLRPFKLTGSLIMMVSKVTTRIIPFILILMIVIYGFSQALYLQANKYPDSGYTSMQLAYLSAFASITGSGVNVGIDVGDKTDMMLAIESLFTGFTQILLLNLLIAFLSYIYAGIQDQADAVGSYERCKIIMSQVRPWGAPKGDRWIHFLKKETDVAKDKSRQVDKESTNAKIDELKKELEVNQSSMKQVQEVTQNNIKQGLNEKLEASEKRVLAKIDSITDNIAIVAQAGGGTVTNVSNTLGTRLDNTDKKVDSAISSVVEIKLELKRMQTKVDTLTSALKDQQTQNNTAIEQQKTYNNTLMEQHQAYNEAREVEMKRVSDELEDLKISGAAYNREVMEKLEMILFRTNQSQK